MPGEYRANRASYAENQQIEHAARAHAQDERRHPVADEENGQDAREAGASLADDGAHHVAGPPVGEPVADPRCQILERLQSHEGSERRRVVDLMDEPDGPHRTRQGAPSTPGRLDDRRRAANRRDVAIEAGAQIESCATGSRREKSAERSAATPGGGRSRRS